MKNNHTRIELAPMISEIWYITLECFLLKKSRFINKLKFIQVFIPNEKNYFKIKHTFQMPRICILAIISAVNKKVMHTSHINVTYWKIGIFSNVFGVFNDTDASDNNAHIRIIRRTHSYNFQINLIIFSIK